MKKTKIVVTAIILCVLMMLMNCGSDNYDRRVIHTERNNQGQQVKVKAESQAVEANLDLAAVLAIVKESGSAEAIEQRVNTPEINNLDLDGNGDIDFIKVTEFSNKISNEYGFSFTVNVALGETQEVASISIKKGDDGRAHFVAHGNPSVYGENHYYRSNSLLENLLLWNYLTTPHPYYNPYYSYGHYPSYYGSHRTVSHTVYRTRTKVYRSSSTRMKTSGINKYKKSSNLRSPNKGKNSKAYSSVKSKRKSLRSPTKTQKKFALRKEGKAIGKGGFGKKSARITSKRSFYDPTKNSRHSSYKKKREKKSSGFFGSSSKKLSFGSSKKKSSSFGSSRKKSSSRRVAKRSSKRSSRRRK